MRYSNSRLLDNRKFRGERVGANNKEAQNQYSENIAIPVGGVMEVLLSSLATIIGF